MPAAKVERVAVRLENNGNKFYTYNAKTIYDGFLKAYKEYGYEERVLHNDIKLKDLSVGKQLKEKVVELKEHHGNPPARYNQASLIKALEESGVGRPSTYSTMAQSNIKSGYTSYENKHYIVTPLGKNVIEQLEQFFPDVINVEYTKKMEENLDAIAHKSEG
jgi:DNA topoisomerase-1